MGQQINVNQLRGNQIMSSAPIPMQKDQMSWKMSTEIGGASPFDSFWLRTTQGVGLLDIQRQDLLVDIVTGEQFRVFGRPMRYQESYIRIPVEQIVGT